MKKALLSAVALLSFAAPASASIIPTLEGLPVDNGDGTFTFNYQGTLAGDQGVTKGSKLVIFDFAGYVTDSIFGPGGFVLPTVELTSTGLVVPSGAVDNPTIENLVFTWDGPDFHTSGGPFADIDFNGLGAKSTLGGLAESFFAVNAIKNNGTGPGGAGTLATNQGFVTVPGVIPEPATWAMMIGGFGMVGATMRRRRAAAKTVTA